ncbi:hypothetical protein ACX80V_16925 [Arthrobacter sp. MDT3-24]
MTDQANPGGPEKDPDPTHLRPVDGSDATASDTPGDVPAEPGTSTNTDGLGRKVMSPETENFMKWYRQNQGEGIKMQLEQPRVHKSVHNVHTRLAGQPATFPLPYARETRKGTKILQDMSPEVMSSAQLRPHE